MPIPSIDELRANGGVIKRVEESSSKLVTYRIIKAYEARNFDGSYSGIYSLHTEGQRDIIEMSYVDCGKRRYFNY